MDRCMRTTGRRRHPCGPRQRARRRASVAAAVALVALPISAEPASATYYSGGVGSPRFTVQITGVNSTWASYLRFGVGAWNATRDTGVQITTVSSSTRTMTAGSYDQTWLGLYTPGGTRANRSFTIQANARVVGLTTGGTYRQWARFVATHELGHALSMADNPPTSSASVMKYVPPTSSPATTPRAYDVAELIRIY